MSKNGKKAEKIILTTNSRPSHLPNGGDETLRLEAVPASGGKGQWLVQQAGFDEFGDHFTVHGTARKMSLAALFTAMSNFEAASLWEEPAGTAAKVKNEVYFRDYRPLKPAVRGARL